jgi:hypothetical protein
MPITSSLLHQKLCDNGITDLVVWGLKTSTHTHRYIHKAVFHSFQKIAELGNISAHWVDDKPIGKMKDVTIGKRPLIFCSPHYDCARHVPNEGIPQAVFIAHADSSICYDTKRPIVDLTRYALQHRAVYWKTFREIPPVGAGFEAVDRPRLVFFNATERRITMPWATDLLPDEIDQIKDVVVAKHKSKELFPGKKVLFVGSVWKRNKETIKSFSKACKSFRLDFRVERIEDTEKLITETNSSFMAPAVQGEGHMESNMKFYVPCRIMKNISYGALGVTNNPGVNELFGGQLMCSNDLQNLVAEYVRYVTEWNSEKLDAMLSMMTQVQEHHTYFNRMAVCLDQLKID